MKKISTHFRQALLSLFLSVSLVSMVSAQCVLQGTISEPACGSFNTTPNVGGMQEWNMSSTIGGDYTVSISSGSNANGSYSVSPASFTATGSSTVVDILAGGTCSWAAGGTSATLTYTRIGYTNTTSNATMCQGTTRSLTVSPAPFTAGTWSVIPGTGNGSISGTTFTATTPGTVTIRYAKGGCNSDVSFSIDAAPTTATVGGTQSVCGLVSNGLGGNTPTTGTGTWTKTSGPGTVTFSNANTGNATATVSAYGTYTFQWSISNGVCSPSTASVTVTYYQTPTTATVGATQNICSSLTTASLGGNTPAVGTGTWTQLSGPGTTTFSAVNSGSSTATASVTGTYVYTWTIANGACTPSSANVTVNYYATPTTAMVGGTQNLCGTLTSGNLGGNAPTVGTGAWSQVSGPGTTTFSNAASPSATATASAAGSYTYRWTISNGTCTPSTADVVVNFYATPPVASVAASPLSACGTLTSPALGGNAAAPGTGTWSQTSGPGTTTFSNANSESSTATASVIGTYVYTWTITNGNCAPTSANVTVTYYTAPTTATVGPNQAVCSLTSNALGGNTPSVGTGTWTQAAGPGVTFFSSVNSGSSTASVSVQGTYIFTWTIANGPCTSSANDTVSFYSNPTIATVGADQKLCGTLTSNALGGNTPAIGAGTWSQIAGPGTTTFSNPNAGSSTATVSAYGVYTYEWTISNGTCTPSTADVSVYYIPTPTGGSIANAAFCSAAGSASISVTGVSNATQYSWALPAGLTGSSTASTIIIGGTSPGTYTVTVTPSDVQYGVTCTGSPITGTVRILSQPVIDSVNAGTVSCYGGNDDTIRIYGHTSNGSLFYSIDNGVTFSNSTGVFTGQIAGSYNLQVRDDSTCTTSYTGNPAIVTQPTALQITIASYSNVRCNGDSTGFINISVSGATPQYTFAWNNGSTSQNIIDLGAGSYTVTVTDAKGCQQQLTQAITSPPVITASATGTNISCYGANDGTASVTASGGVGTLTYTWSSGSSSPSLTGLAAALYSVTVKDANGCQVVSSYTVTEPAPLRLSLSSTNVTCYGNGNGTVTANVTGGTGAYTYTWSPAVSTTATVTNVGPGTYALTVSDVNNCSAVDSAVVTQPISGLSVSSIVTPVRCTGEANGAIQLLPSGGVGGYTYAWAGGQSLQIISGLAAGIYTATVTDGNGCQVVVSDTLVNPTPITSGVTGTSASCVGAGGGSATLTVSGGAAPYTFLWSDLETTQNISNLSGGTYRVIITDANGCQHSDSVIITQPQALVATFSVTNATCNGAANGTVTVTVTGGTGAGTYTYAWTPSGSVTNSVSPASPGTYVVTVTDGNGCTLVDSAAVTQPQALSTIVSVTNVQCYGGNTGSATVSVLGGTGSYSYTWSPNVSTSATALNLTSGIYNVTVTDGNGCNTTTSVTITQPAATVALSTSVTDITCHNANDGAISTQVSGGSGSYTYAWTGVAATTPSVSGLSAGTYTVTVTDASGCTATGTGTITNPSDISSTTSGTNLLCAGAANGTASVTTVSGGTGPYTYLWSNFAATQTISGLSGGLYRVVITDAHGCQHRDSVFVTEPQPLSLSMTFTSPG
ncbi:MAG: SprB repeat-containing protein, partial [Bacteroidetes bacterium]|nr:SprB repeat-containing protein [Bacteroidota bacterium]